MKLMRDARYAFRSEEKVALQEIGPRLTLKLRWLKKGIPASQQLGDPAKPLEFDEGGDEPEFDPAAVAEQPDAVMDAPGAPLLPELTGPSSTLPPKGNEYEWQWKPELETTRRTFFL
jgi:ribosome production factor 1